MSTRLRASDLPQILWGEGFEVVAVDKNTVRLDVETDDGIVSAFVPVAHAHHMSVLLARAVSQAMRMD